MKDFVSLLIVFSSVLRNTSQSQNVVDTAPGECEKEIEQIFRTLFINRDNGINETTVRSNWRRMIDSTGLPGMDIMQCVQMWPGSYDNCVKVDGARYCIVSFDANITVKQTGSFAESYELSVGMCVPKSCTTEEVPAILNRLSNSDSSKTLLAQMGGQVTLMVSTARCYPRKEEYRFPNKFIACASALALLLTVATLATFECFSSRSTLLSCFSLRENAKFLFSIEDTSKSIRALHFMRVYAMCLIIFGHTHSKAILKSNDICQPFRSIDGTLFESFFQSMDLNVDTFFVISGCLMSFISFESINKLKLSNWLSFSVGIVKRYMRLTPLYAFVIWLRVALVDDLVSYPLWASYGSAIVTEASDCEDVFWTNLLYMGNFVIGVDLRPSCLGYTWYLANDMQFYVFSLALIIVLSRNRVLFKKLVVLAIVASTLLTLFASHSQNANILFNIKPLNTVYERYSRHFVTVYIKPYCRFGTYGVGLLLGTILFEKGSFTYRKSTSIAMASLAFAFPLSPMLAYHLVTLSDFQISWFTGLVRISWSIGISLLIYLSYVIQRSGNYGPLWLLLSPKWIPLSKLTYSIYLIHMVCIQFHYNALKESIEWSRLYMFFLFVYFLTMSIVIGILLFLFVQRPAERLWVLIEMKLGFSNRKEKTKAN